MSGAAGSTQRPPVVDARHAWFLDIDGTLLEFAPTPSGVRVDAALHGLIRALFSRAEGALALISGRSVADIDGLFPGLCLPIAGQHGLERRDARGASHHHAPDDVDWPWLTALVKATVNGMKGIMIEDKGLTLAVHFRKQPDLEDRLRLALLPIVTDAGAAVMLQPGKCVFEIKPAGRDKGTAIAEFMAEAPFQGRPPLFIGDDVTDEYGFRVVNDLGGDTIKVGGGTTVARWRLNDVGAVRAWIGEVLGMPADPAVNPGPAR